jgi:hypothetical protein
MDIFCMYVRTWCPVNVLDRGHQARARRTKMQDETYGTQSSACSLEVFHKPLDRLGESVFHSGKLVVW